jgi:branched-chain amino acid transport system substrate-binding protein
MELKQRTRLLRIGLAALGLVLTPVHAQAPAKAPAQAQQGPANAPAQPQAPAQAQAPAQTAALAPAKAPVPTEILPLVGTSPTDIIIGHVAAYTGPVASDAIELGQGAEAYFDAVNDKGGVDGRKMRILRVDDNFKPDNTVKLMAEIKGKAVALLPMVGSANGAAVVKANVLEIPVVGTIPSPDLFRNPISKNIFHIRASDTQQTEKILEQLITVGMTNIGIFVPNNPFGEQATKQVEAYLASRNLKLAVNAVYLLAGPKADVAPGLKALEGKSYQALIFYGPPKSVAAGIAAVKKSGETALLYALSYADSKYVIEAAGLKLAHGVAISQVMPNLNTRTMPLVKSFHEDWAKYGKSKDAPTHFTIEGYIAGRLIVEAIRRTKDASPDGVRRGLEQLRAFDLGGYVIDFSPTNHQGSRHVDLSVIGGSGKLVY